VDVVSVVVRDEAGEVFFAGDGSLHESGDRRFVTVPFEITVGASAPVPYPTHVTIAVDGGAARRAVAHSSSCAGQYQIEIDSVTYAFAD
jgi:hypothetical protein